MTEQNQNKKPGTQDQRKDIKVDREPASKGMTPGSSSKKDDDRLSDKDRASSKRQDDEDEDDSVSSQRQGRREP